MQASPDWTARTALVTGAGGAGVGGATARRLAAEGVSIVALDNHAERLREACAALRSEYGVAVHEAHVDLRDRGELDRSLAESQDALGPIDTLVNNAAISIQGSIFDQSPEVFDDVLDVDLAACWYLTRALIGGMRTRNFGSIVNVSSAAAYNGGRGRQAPYSAAKAGLNELTRSVAIEGGHEFTPLLVSQPGEASGSRSDSGRETPAIPSSNYGWCEASRDVGVAP